MLRNRILTAAVLIPLVVWGVLALPTPWFVAVAGLFLALAVWEWAGLVPLSAWPSRLVFFAVAGGLAWAGWYGMQTQAALIETLLAGAVIWWLVAAVWLRWPQVGRGWVLIKALLAAVALLPVWLALGVLHARPEQGPQLVLFVLVLMWVADSGAYFAGRALGKHKLAPKVSPGKTWEGVAGGVLGSALFALAAGLWFDWTGNRLTGFIVLGIACALLSIVGDLFISLLKRQQGLKDTGHLFPGHGGVLDRIDSLLAAGPAFVFGLAWLEGQT